MVVPLRTSALAAVLAVAFAIAPALAAQPVQQALAPADALVLIRGDAPPQVLDVRTAEEFAAGHVPGAILIPHDQLAARLAELDRDRPLLVYCRSGRRSTIAEELLIAEGFDVRQIDGSWLRWQAEGLPEETDAATAAQEDGE